MILGGDPILGGGGGGVETQKTEDYSKFWVFFQFLWYFFRFSSVFPFPPILSWSLNRFWSVWLRLFLRHLQSSIGISCVIRQFLASLDLTGDTIFEWLELQFFVEVQTKKTEG